MSQPEALLLSLMKRRGCQLQLEPTLPPSSQRYKLACESNNARAHIRALHHLVADDFGLLI
jgi:hypothetical protein